MMMMVYKYGVILGLLARNGGLC